MKVTILNDSNDIKWKSLFHNILKPTFLAIPSKVKIADEYHKILIQLLYFINFDSINKCYLI